MVSEARIIDIYDTVKRIEKQIQDMQIRLGNIESTLREIHSSSPSERRKAMY